MTLTQPFGRPQARLRRVKHRLVLALSGRPSEAQVQVRYLGHRGRSRQLRVLRTLHGVFTSLTLPSSGVVEVSVRYTDPYDVERASPWATLRLPASASTAAKARRGTMRRSSVTIAVMLAVVAWLSPSQAFAAGTYQVSACNFAPEAANNSWTWATNDPAVPAHYAEHVNCPYRAWRRRRQGRSGRRAIDNRRAWPLKWGRAGHERGLDVHGTGGHVDHRAHL